MTDREIEILRNERDCYYRDSREAFAALGRERALRQTAEAAIEHIVLAKTDDERFAAARLWREHRELLSR